MDRVLKIIRKMNSSNLPLMRKLYHYYLRVIFSCDIMPGTTVGDNVHFAHTGLGVVLNPDVKIGNNVSIGCNVVIGGRSGLKNLPIIEDNVIIGANTTIIGPVRIGKNAQIGAGSVVVKSVPQNAVVVGNPAKIKKYIQNVN